MNVSRLFILRPVATTLLMVAILLAGLLAFRFLPVSALPEVDYPTIQVITLYPGASPDVMASSVTAPLERQFGQMPGLGQMTSSSSGGASMVTLVFSLDMSLDVAEQQVQAAINAASNLLPSDLPAPPIYSKVNPADAPIVTLAVTSPTLSLPKLEDIVDTRLAQKISQLPGVGLVSISGGQRPAIRIQANSRALAARGLTLESVRTSIINANVNQAKGSFDGPRVASTIDGNDQLKSVDEYRNLIIAWHDGSAVRLKDVADVIEAAENVRLAAWANRQPAVILTIQRQPGANVIQVVDRIRDLLPELRSTLPGAVDVQLLSDRTTTIRASIEDVGFELLLAIALVVMVIFIFLRNLSATLIPSVAVPLSLVATLGVLYLLGFSINNLTLMALTIATGFVVDDAIVMIENIARYSEEGHAPSVAALRGSAQIGFTIISLTFSLVAVLIPLLFMGDVVGRLFREFAITLAVAILLSALISLTLTPMMCARLLKPVSAPQQGRFYHTCGAFFDSVIQLYGIMLTWVLARQRLMLWIVVVTVLLTMVLYVIVPKGFFPIQDNGAIQISTVAPQSVSFHAMAQRQQQLAAELLQDPAVESLSSFIGVDGVNAALNNGRFLVNLKPFHARDPLAVVLKRLQRRVQVVPGITAYWQPLQDLTLETRVSRAQYQFTLQASHADTLSTWVPTLVARLKLRPELTEVTSDLQDRGLQAYLKIDRERAGQLGISMATIDNALYNAFGQRLISTVFTQTNQYRVVLEEKHSGRGLATLAEIYVPTVTGVPVPLTAVAHVEERLTPLVINRLEQLPSATISFSLADGASLGQAVDAIHQAQAESKLPSTLNLYFQGAVLAFQASLSNTLWLFLAAVVTMYIVLGVLYESYIHPITILSTLPSAGIGALLALLLSNNSLNVIAVIGIILLIGIVKKNAIMMVDFALDAQRHQGLSPRDAIYQACLLRFRPILMTTMAALFGALPLMLGTGIGAELRQPLGVTMVGGLLVSQMLTLFTTPVIYLAFDRVVQKWGGRTVEP